MLNEKSRIRIPHLQEAKNNSERFIMLTAYDAYSASIFDDAQVPVLLVGDSASNTVLGLESTMPITLEEMIIFSKAVTRTAKRSLVVADLPFGSYEVNAEQAVLSSIRLMKEGGAQAVKLEGGESRKNSIKAIVSAGMPVMGHIGFTPQSEHSLGGYKVQGRGDTAADKILADALAVQEAGAFAVVLEMVPSLVADKVTKKLTIPTIGIGAGPGTDGQVLVWQDMAGLGKNKVPSFVKKYADLRKDLTQAVNLFTEEVKSGSFPGVNNSF